MEGHRPLQVTGRRYEVVFAAAPDKIKKNNCDHPPTRNLVPFHLTIEINSCPGAISFSIKSLCTFSPGRTFYLQHIILSGIEAAGELLSGP